MRSSRSAEYPPAGSERLTGRRFVPYQSEPVPPRRMRGVSGSASDGSAGKSKSRKGDSSSRSITGEVAGGLRSGLGHRQSDEVALRMRQMASTESGPDSGER